MKKQDPLPDQPEPSYLSYIEKESQYLQSSRFAKDRLFWTQTFQNPPEYHSLAGQTSLQKQSTSASRDTITLSPHLGQRFESLRRTKDQYHFLIYGFILHMHQPDHF
ncbi:hypothetical protein KQR57_10805 [Bacillus inaquosorum]|nr:hypothetical protein [Bacillus inaquosorum]